MKLVNAAGAVVLITFAGIITPSAVTSCPGWSSYPQIDPFTTGSNGKTIDVPLMNSCLTNTLASRNGSGFNPVTSPALVSIPAKAHSVRAEAEHSRIDAAKGGMGKIDLLSLSVVNQINRNTPE